MLIITYQLYKVICLITLFAYMVYFDRLLSFLSLSLLFLLAHL